MGEQQSVLNRLVGADCSGSHVESHFGEDATKPRYSVNASQLEALIEQRRSLEAPRDTPVSSSRARFMLRDNSVLDKVMENLKEDKVN